MSKDTPQTAQILLVIVLLVSLPLFYFLFSKVLLPHFWNDGSTSENASAPTAIESSAKPD